MIWLVACLLCAVVDEAAFYYDGGDDYEEAYYGDDSFTSPMTVSRDYTRRKRFDVTTFLNQLSTATKKTEYEDNESVLMVPRPVQQLTMQPVSPENPKTSDEANTDRVHEVLRQPEPPESGKSDSFTYIYPEIERTSTTINTGITPIYHPTRSPQPITDSPAYSESPRRETSNNENAAYPDISSTSTKTKTKIVKSDPTFKVDRSTKSPTPSTDVSVYAQFPTESPNSADLSTNPNSSPRTDTTTETISSMSTFTADLFTLNVSSNSMMSTISYSANVTECLDCEENPAAALRWWWWGGTTTTTATPTTVSTTEVYEYRKIDVPKLLALLNSVIYDDASRFNLTKRFNETLQKYSIPTCADAAPTTPTTEPPSTINFNDAKVVAKCFVCGLDVERVPYSSACADAFSGDFIPLIPVDTKARGKIASFRKYCRYLDVNRVITTEEEPHSVFGRFTGGCSVRWVDLTSIYTQRACRNRRRAVLGRHFASKRMAKLEMALSDLDNGCIISPMATLLPVSRGISLYARFHACVCTGSWCNKAISTRHWITNNVMFIVITYVNLFYRSVKSFY